MSLSITVHEDATLTAQVADWTHRAIGTVFETDEHGFSYLSTFISYSLQEAFRIYDATPGAHVIVSNGANTIWEGRIEDRRIMTGGLEIGAFGYWRAMSDSEYNALWVDSQFRNWLRGTADDISSLNPSMYDMDNEGRLFIGLRKNEVYTTAADIGGWVFWMPHNSGRALSEITFDYAVNLPTNWRAVTSSYNDALSSGNTEDTITGIGSLDTGSKEISLTGSPAAILWHIYNNTGSNYTYTGDTGAVYAKITNVRVKSTTSNSIYADEIVKAIITWMNGINGSMISSSTALVESPAVALTHEVYEEMLASDVLKRLAKVGDSATPPKWYEVGVWENQVLYFRERGSQGQSWYVDIADISIDSTLDTLVNGSYAVYKDDRGRTRRASVTTDTDSITKYGITRYRYVQSEGTDATSAGKTRDAFIEQRKDITPRTQIQVHGFVYTASGARMPAYHVRSGDTLTIRNLPITGSATVDKIRSFIIARTSYDCSTRILTPIPELEPPSLEFLVAQQAANGRG